MPETSVSYKCPNCGAPAALEAAEQFSRFVVVNVQTFHREPKSDSCRQKLSAIFLCVVIQSSQKIFSEVFTWLKHP